MDNFEPPAAPTRFDAYAATVPCEVRDLLDVFEGFVPGARVEMVDRAPQGYAFGARIVDEDGQIGQIWWGGMHPHAHASFQGHGSHDAALLLRECFPEHSVSRADPVLIDSTTPGAYDVLQGHCVELASDLRITVGTAGDHLVTMQGRTLYLGSTSAVVRCRLYDKAAERRARLRNPAKLAALPQHWARLEFQVRPHGIEAKRAAARASPAEVIGAARWARRLALEVAGLDVVPFSASPAWRESDHDRAYHSMLRQYGTTLRQVLNYAGSPECLGLQLAHDLAQL